MGTTSATFGIAAMSTFGELKSRIDTDYLNRTDLSASTARSILAAIRHYERQRFRFNETATSLTTSSGQTFAVLPTNLLELDLLQITVSSADYKLVARDFDWIKRANATRTTGEPTDYAIYQNRIELFPVPGSAYSLPCYYVKRLSALSADSDVNAWISSEALDVIAYHATKLMWATVLRNTEEAVKFADLERIARNELYRNRDAFPHHAIRATEF